MPEKDEPVKSDDSASQASTPIPRWDLIDGIATKMEKIFFDEAGKIPLSPFEQSIMLTRLNELFKEYEMLAVIQHVMSQSGGPNVEFKGSTHLYK